MVCTFTSKTSKQQIELLTKFDASLHYFYDMDDAGRLGWKQAQKDLRNIAYGVRRITWEDSKLDLGAMNMEQFKSILET